MTQKRKVLFFIESLSGGGAEKVLATLVRHLDKSLFEITLCSVVNVGKYIDYVTANANYCYLIKDTKTIWGRIKYKLLYTVFPSWLVYSFFIPKGSDVEIAFIEGYATRIIGGSTNSKSRKLAWVHTDFSQNHWTRIAYKSNSEEEKCYNKYNHIYCVSSNVKDSLAAVYPSLKNISVMYNPVDSDQIRALSQDEIPEVVHNNNQLRLITVGRLVPQKGYDRLLPIILRLNNEGYSCSLVILGDGPDKRKLQAYVQEHQMESYIHFMGFQSNPYPFFRDSDLYVCSSRVEGYSTVVMEALILGVPVITTDCSGMKELLGNSEYGMVVSNEDEALFKGIKCLISDTALLNRYQSKAAKRGNMFQLSTLMGKIEQAMMCQS